MGNEGENTPRFLDCAVKDLKCGKGVVVVRPTNVYGCELEDDVFIGPFCEVQKGAKIGARTRVQSHTFICSMVTIGADCFIGHGAQFTNDLFKTGGFSRNPSDWKGTVVGNNVSMGSNATILPVKICDNVIIGAGSVVTKDIVEPGVYFGNPAKKNNKTKIQISPTAEPPAKKARN
eukprot:TRINITY_DN118_c1_g4_i1.p1 TRINITY_DN118_c1_g4~~TRINITY_DN118_c1_g4_i1.p1  ORF type:complete len:176 (-),score=20.38 TRINITY_DN118_c1_g4_i1:237-764(-)